MSLLYQFLSISSCQLPSVVLRLATFGSVALALFFEEPTVNPRHPSLTGLTPSQPVPVPLTNSTCAPRQSKTGRGERSKHLNCSPYIREFMVTFYRIPRPKSLLRTLEQINRFGVVWFVLLGEKGRPGSKYTSKKQEGKRVRYEIPNATPQDLLLPVSRIGIALEKIQVTTHPRPLTGRTGYFRPHSAS